MKITDLNNSGKIAQLQKNQAVQVAQTAEHSKGTSSGSQNADQVEISRATREAQKIQEVLKNTPDIRTDKVDSLKAKIQSGEYKVDSKKIATAMVSDLMQDLP